MPANIAHFAEPENKEDAERAPGGRGTMLCFIGGERVIKRVSLCTDVDPTIGIRCNVVYRSVCMDK